MYSYIEVMSSKGSLSSTDLIQLFLTLFTVCTGALLTFKLFSKKRKVFLRRLEAIPGPRKFPLIGNAPQLVHLVKNPQRGTIPWAEHLLHKYGNICRIWLFDEPKVIVGCLDTALQLLQKDQIPAKSSDVSRAAKVIGGRGLMSLPPHIHSERRKMWMPSFNRKQIENSLSIFNREGNKLRETLENCCTPTNGESVVFDFFQFSVTCTFRIIAASAFGTEFMESLPESSSTEHIRCLHTLSKNLAARGFMPWLMNDFVYFNLTSAGRETRRSFQTGNMLTKQAVKDRKKLRAGLTKKDEITSECFMDHLLDFVDQGALSEEDVVEELNNFIVAGYDTSGATLCYTLYLLALNPECQEKVVEELRQVVDFRENHVVTTAQTKNMKFLDLCIKETLRIYPVLPALPHRTISDVELLDGKIIPAGVDVFVNLHYIQNDPKYFPEPKKFIPERHLTPNPAWMPFSIGSRNCIGQVYGMQEVKVLLTHLLLAYKFETLEEPGYQPIYQVVFMPENGMRFRITKRDF